MILIPDYLVRIWDHLSKKRKIQVLLTIFIMLLGALSESLTLVSVVPFLRVILNQSYNFYIYNKYLETISFVNEDNFKLFITLSFIFFILISSSLRLYTLWRNSIVSGLIGSDLSTKAYSNVINQEFEDYTNVESSSVITACTNYVEQTLQILNSSFTILSSMILVSGLCIVLLIARPVESLLIILFFSASYFLVVFSTKNKLRINSSIIAEQSRKQVSTLQKGFGSFREILLSNTQNFFVNQYRDIDLGLRIKQMKSQFIAFFPRYILEAISISAFALLAFISAGLSENSIDILPYLGALALASQKLLPLTQNVYNSWALIRTRKESLYLLLDLLDSQKDLPKELTSIKNNKNSFNVLKFLNISFAYKSRFNGEMILKNINLEIKKGEKIGIIGKTGSGKSTLLDLMMGLLKPTSGNILIDEVDLHGSNNNQIINNWRSMISHVPQDIYISDGSILENIALCERDKINESHAINSAKLAKLDDFIQTLKYKYLTKLGERGIRLSGGQIQRLALSRAIYKSCKFLILDEATSALDYDTEDEIMDALDSLSDDYTIIYVAHRLKTISKCDKLYKIENGDLKLVVT